MALTSVISTSNRQPGAYIKVLFGAGNASGTVGPRKLLLVGHKLSTGTYAANVPVSGLNADDGATGLGRGSELHRMQRSALAFARDLDLTLAPLDEPGAGVAATGTIVFAGTATEAGAIIVEIAGETVEVSVSNGDTSATVAATAEVAIDTLENAPVTASVAASTVTLTARTKGERGNLIRYRVRNLPAGITATPSGVDTDAGVVMSSGSGADAYTTLQTNLSGSRYHLIAIAGHTLTDAQDWRDFLETEDDPDVGVRSAVVAGSVDTPANSITFATGINAQRGRVVWLQQSDLEPGVLAAIAAARMTQIESVDPAAPMSKAHGTNLPGVIQPPDITVRPLDSQIVSALNNGITPITFDNAGRAYLERAITTRSQNNAGSAPDYGTYDTAKQTVPDYVADVLEAAWPAFVAANPKLTDDDPDGNPPPAGVATPSKIKDWVIGKLADLAEPGALQALEREVDLRDSIVVERASTPDGRVNAYIPVDVIDGLYQLAATVAQGG